MDDAENGQHRPDYADGRCDRLTRSLADFTKDGRVVLFEADGDLLYAQGAAKAGRCYRYYLSRRLVSGSANDHGKSWLLAAPEIERAVAIAGRQILRGRMALLEALKKSEIDSPDVGATLE